MIDKIQAVERAKKAISEIKAGKMVILVDDEDRENEGDLTMAADFITPEAVTFMATKGCGLICVTLTPERTQELKLPMMTNSNTAPLQTAFTVSVEAATGVSTGISAADRAHTIKVVSDPKYSADDVISPGHVFPLRAMPGGVLQRTGQTEGSVELARLAGLTPAGVICEIMNQDGTMARMDDLQVFAKEHNLVICSIADLIEYRLQHDSLVKKVSEHDITIHGNTEKGEFKAHVYKTAPGIKRQEFVALVHGDISTGEPIACRGHVANIVDDVLGQKTKPNSPSFKETVDAIVKRGKGVILYLPSRDSIHDVLTNSLQPSLKQTAEDKEGVIREYGIGAQILLDLGVTKLQMISNNPHRLVGLDAWGFEEVVQISLKEV